MTRPNSRSHRTLAALVLGIGLAGFAWSALANRAPTDRQVASLILAEQATSGSSIPATSHARAQAKRALERADQARAAGDSVHAGQLDGLAREWAEMARDVAAATSAEQRADQSQRAAASASAEIRKTRAMIEALVARRARAQGQLQKVHAASSAPISSAALSAARLRPPVPGSSSKSPPGATQ